MEFNPVFRMIVMSDVHYKVDDTTEPERFKKGMQQAYDYASKSDYKNIDALYVVGDFADSGREDQMNLFKESLDKYVHTETQRVLMLASHEFMSAGVESAYEKLVRIFNQPADNHKIINGFHCISMSCDKGCRIEEPKQNWLKEELKKAAEDGCDKPIFVFQHPHLTDTVYGSINWGEDDIISILMNYPQVIDFSGHSHAPINDPRSIYQKYFSAFGTGSLSYFELDEFNYQGGTVPFNAYECAQYLIVEVDEKNRVLVKPFDILSGEFFNEGALIEQPSVPESFVYTDKRFVNPETPFFTENTECEINNINNEYIFSFTQAKGINERVNSYSVVLKNAENGCIIRQICETSSYYVYYMPEKTKVSFGMLNPGKYIAEIRAEGFWHNISDKFMYEFEVK